MHFFVQYPLLRFQDNLGVEIRPQAYPQSTDVSQIVRLILGSNWSIYPGYITKEFFLISQSKCESFQ